MANTIGKFGYRVMGGKKTMTSPIAVVVLQSYSDQDGSPCISPYLMTNREIDEHIQALKSDLDEVGKRARAALAKAN